LIAPMRPSRYLECLAADQVRLGQVAAADLTAAVPTCAEWTMRDLVQHVAEVYLHKVECMRTGTEPTSWPPDLSGEEPLALLDRAFQALRAEFEAREPDSFAATWHDPDQTVGFWIRRMAQEALIHRVDAELAAGVSIADIPPDLAADGVDEVLRLFLAYGSRRWPDAFIGLLPSSAEQIVVTTGEYGWLVHLGPDGVTVTPGVEPATVTATVSAAPRDLLLWLWRRSGDESVERQGETGAVARLRQLLEAATQ